MTRAKKGAKLYGTRQVDKNSAGATLLEFASGKPMGGKIRIAALFIATIILLGIFISRGGPAIFTSPIAYRALRYHDHDKTRKWIDRGNAMSWLTGGNADALLIEARLARREGKLDLMENKLVAAGKLGISEERIEREQILARLQSGEIDEYELQVTSWLSQSDPDSAEICDAYANGLAVVSRLDDAFNVLNAWHQDDRTNPVPSYRIGRIYEYYDNIEAAEKSYLTSIECDAVYLPAYFRLGNLYLDAKRPNDALDLFQQCLGMPNPFAPKIGIAKCRAELGDTDSARNILAEILIHPLEGILASYEDLKESPETFIAAVELGKLEVNSGNYQEGIQWLDKALEFNPRDLAARYSRAVALRQSGQAAFAVAEFEEIEATKKALEKVNALRNEIGRNPTDADSRIELGKLLLAHESERNGLFWLQSALTFDPNNAEAHAALAAYYEGKADESSPYAELARQHRRLAKVHESLDGQ